MSRFILKVTYFVVIALLGFSESVSAQLKFKNSTQNPISVAIGWYAVRDNYEGYITKGWYTVNPGQTITTDLQFSSGSDFFYYYGKSVTTTWAGDNTLLGDPSNAFEIMNANMKYVASENPEYNWLGFTRVDLYFEKSDSRTYTLEFVSAHEENGSVAMDTAAETVGFIIDGVYKQDGNKIRLERLESSDVKFTITTPVEGDCDANSITGIAGWKMFGTIENGFEYWEYDEGGCMITIMQTAGGGVEVQESECQSKHCEGGYEWGGTYYRVE